jgi:hypothetical protein
MMHYRTCGFYLALTCAEYQNIHNTITDTRREMGTFPVTYGANQLVTNYSITDTNFFVIRNVGVAIDSGTVEKYTELYYGTDGTTESTYCATCNLPNTNRRSWLQVLVDYSHLRNAFTYKFKTSYPIQNTYNIVATVKERTTITTNKQIDVITIPYALQFQCKGREVKTYQKLKCYGQIMSQKDGVQMTVKTFDSTGTLYSKETVNYTVNHIVTYGYKIQSTGTLRFFPAKNFIGLDEEIMISYGILKKIEFIATHDGTLDLTVNIIKFNLI